MKRENASLSFEEYFWQDVDVNGKVVLYAVTGFGYHLRSYQKAFGVKTEGQDNILHVRK